MAHEKEIAAMTSAIVNAHGGKAYFNMAQASKIVGCGKNTLPRALHDAGIVVKHVGTSHCISAYELAGFMCIGRVSPVKKGA